MNKNKYNNIVITVSKSDTVWKRLFGKRRITIYFNGNRHISYQMNSRFGSLSYWFTQNK